jgi:hypothetical protein
VDVLSINADKEAATETQNTEDSLLVTSQQSLATENLETHNAQQKVEEKKENKLEEINNDNIKIELLKNIPSVLGAETVREVDGQYFFTPQATEEQHYAVTFLKNFSSVLNGKLNSLMNYFLK